MRVVSEYVREPGTSLRVPALAVAVALGLVVAVLWTRHADRATRLPAQPDAGTVQFYATSQLDPPLLTTAVLRGDQAVQLDALINRGTTVKSNAEYHCPDDVGRRDSAELRKGNIRWHVDIAASGCALVTIDRDEGTLTRLGGYEVDDLLSRFVPVPPRTRGFGSPHQ